MLNQLLHYYPDLPSRVKAGEFFVEATHFEQHLLWKEYVHIGKNEYTKSWEQDTSGNSMTIGEIDGRPICLSCATAIIGGVNVVFWEMTSQLCDFVMAEKWLTDHSEVYRNKDRRTNGMNFSHLFGLIQ